MRQTQSHPEPHSRDRQAAQHSTAQHSQKTDRRQGQEAGTVGGGNVGLSVSMWDCIMMQCMDGEARTEADRQTDRQTDGGQTDRQERQAGRQADKQAGKQTNTQTRKVYENEQTTI